MNLSAFQYPAYRRYFLCAVMSVNAVWFFQIGMAWIAWKTTGSASFVGLTGAVAILPTVVLGPVFGVLADRVPIVAGIWVNTALKIIVVCGSAAAAALGALTPGVILVVVVFFGMTEAAHHPLRLALGPRLVRQHAIPSVVALSALTFNLARTLTPALAGVLIASSGAPTALWIAASLFAVNLFLLPGLRPRPTRDATKSPAFIVDLREGFMHAVGQKRIRQILLIAFGFFFAIRGTLEILPVIADGRFGLGATGLGQMATSVGAGALIAALAKTIWRIDDLGRMAQVVFWFGLCALIGLGLSEVWAVSLVCTAIMGGCATFIGVSSQGALQMRLRDDMRGRVMSVYVAAGMSGSALGASAIGILVDGFGLHVTCSGIALVCGLGLWRIGWPKQTETGSALDVV